MSQQVEDMLFELLSQVRKGESISPNAVAKALNSEHWQRELPKIRAVAVGLARQGRLEFVRKGKVVEPDGIKGIFRLRLPAAD